jgi:hypothetical protein
MALEVVLMASLEVVNSKLNMRGTGTRGQESTIGQQWAVGACRLICMYEWVYRAGT